MARPFHNRILITMRFGIKSASLLVCIRIALAILLCAAGFYLYVIGYATYAEYFPLRRSQELHLIDIFPYYFFMVLPVSVISVFISISMAGMIIFLMAAGSLSQWQNHSYSSEPLIALCAAVQCSVLIFLNYFFYKINN